MIPHERSLVQRLADKPFVLVGVNSDTEPEDLKKQIQENQVTWRSFKNERKDGTMISKEWSVRGWPTLYLIDQNGIIRKKWLGSPSNQKLDEAVDKVLASTSKKS
jgi:Thioredoxin-like